MKIYLLLPILFTAVAPLDAMSRTTTTTTTQGYDDYDDDAATTTTTTYTEENDWFGPGYYYGIWFWTWGQYYPWRTSHWYYPNGRGYYNNHHPVYYHGNHHNGGHGG